MFCWPLSLELTYLLILLDNQGPRSNMQRLEGEKDKRKNNMKEELAEG